MSKSDLQARPIYHRNRDSIEAHLTSVSAALAVTRWLENQTGWSIWKFVRTARRYRTIEIQAGPGQPAVLAASWLLGFAAAPIGWRRTATAAMTPAGQAECTKEAMKARLVTGQTVPETAGTAGPVPAIKDWLRCAAGRDPASIRRTHAPNFQLFDSDREFARWRQHEDRGMSSEEVYAYIRDHGALYGTASAIEETIEQFTDAGCGGFMVFCNAAPEHSALDRLASLPSVWSAFGI